jgi:hypothetical protein
MSEDLWGWPEARRGSVKSRYSRAVYNLLTQESAAWGALPKRPALIGHVCQYVCPECGNEKFRRWALFGYFCKRVSKHKDRGWWFMSMRRDLGRTPE